MNNLKFTDPVCIIGAGKITFSLIPALINGSFYIRHIISRRKSSAENLTEIFGLKNCSDSFNNLSPSLKIFFIAVPDNEICKVVNSIITSGISIKNKLFVHLSGALSAEVLSPLKVKGAKTGAMHIMQTFPQKKERSVQGIFAAIESDQEDVFEFLSGTARKLQMIPFRLESKARAGYHAAGVFAANFITGNIFVSEILKEGTGGAIPDDSGVFLPIAESTLANIAEHGTVNSLSGPIERADLETIELHIEFLRNNLFDEKGRLILLSYLTQSLILCDVSLLKQNNKNKELILLKTKLKKYLSDDFNLIL